MTGITHSFTLTQLFIYFSHLTALLAALDDVIHDSLPQKLLPFSGVGRATKNHFHTLFC